MSSSTPVQIPAGVTVLSWGKATGDWNFCTIAVSALNPGVAGSSGTVAFSSGTIATFLLPT